MTVIFLNTEDKGTIKLLEGELLHHLYTNLDLETILGKNIGEILKNAPDSTWGSETRQCVSCGYCVVVGRLICPECFGLAYEPASGFKD